MRLIIVTFLWIGLFALLVRVLPEGYYLPLYCLFALVGIGYMLWERRRIGARQAALQEAYRAQQAELPGPGTGEEE